MNFSLPSELAEAFPKRPVDLHKYTSGTVTVVGGSARYVHAPVIAGLGARSAGAGLVRLLVPDGSRAAAGALVPEATILRQTPVCEPPKADVTVIGMGLGLTASAEKLLTRLLDGRSGRFVLDADALTLLARRSAKETGSRREGQTLVLTPHVGEAARLLACTSAEVQADRVGALRAIVARYQAVTVLKGPHTLVGAPGRSDIFTCEAGNPFMALGGMGDLLAGILAARWAALAQRGRDDAFLAAAAAVWLHATASDTIVSATPPEDPSVVNTARHVASLCVLHERG